MKYKIAVHTLHKDRLSPVLCPDTIWESTEADDSFSHWCTPEFDLDLTPPKGDYTERLLA